MQDLPEQWASSSTEREANDGYHSSCPNDFERIWKGPLDGVRRAFECGGVAKDRRLLARLQLSNAWHDLPAGQSFASRTPEA